MSRHRLDPGLRKLVGPRSVNILAEDLLNPALSLAARGLFATMHADPAADLSAMPGFADAYDELDAAGYIGEPEPEAPVDQRCQAMFGPRFRSGSVVYYFRRQDGAIKIGFTKHMTSRVRKLTGIHGELDLLATEPGGWHREQSRHREFSDLRIDPKQEWFRPGDALLEHIGDLAGREVAA